MRAFDYLKSKSIDELTDWFDKNFISLATPWWEWWNKNYCNKCEAEVVLDDNGYDRDYGYCELNDKCKYFQDMECVPDCKQVIKMWLESECNTEDENEI